MNTQTETITLPLANHKLENFILVPFKLFQKIQKDQIKLEQTLKQQQELADTLELIREGEEEYLAGKTTTEHLASLVS